jgi:predicted ester cyclase
VNESLPSRIRAANDAILVNGILTAIPEFFAQDYVAHTTDADLTAGHDAIRRMVEGWRRAFADLAVQVEILVEGSGRIAWQRTLRATHAGNYMGFPATGLKLVWRDMVASRFQDSLIVEDWVITDLAEQLLRARKR